MTENLQHWVNDGLMVVFFFVVGLEIKRELAIGELHDARAAALPAAAAVGFTVSLFIADLAYDDPALTEAAKIGIFAGSLLAALIGSALMMTAGPPSPSVGVPATDPRALPGPRHRDECCRHAADD